MKSSVFNIAMILAAAMFSPAAAATLTAPAGCHADGLHAADTTAATAYDGADDIVTQRPHDDAQPDSSSLTPYERRVYRYRRIWNFLIPTQVITQYAGNMGMLSMGVGWDYGHHRNYETNLLFGYLPKADSQRAKMTMTVKQNFIPWRLPVGHDFNVEPLSCGIYFNTVFGHEFWGREPQRYPDKYYEFLSTKLRVNVFVGQRFTAVVPRNRRKFIKSLTAFYEVSTCDLYVRAMFQDSNVKLWDILGLSIGVKVQTL